MRAQAAPGSVRATLANRDRIDSEDSVSILLSTFNDGRQALMFSVNPLGVQADGTIVEGGRSRGEAFRAYQRRVNAFWPGPQRSSAAAGKHGDLG